MALSSISNDSKRAPVWARYTEGCSYFSYFPASETPTYNDWYRAKAFVDRLKAHGAIPQDSKAAEMLDQYTEVVKSYDIITASLAVPQSAEMKEKFDELIRRCANHCRHLYSNSAERHMKFIKATAAYIVKQRCEFVKPIGGLPIDDDSEVAVSDK